MNLSRYTDMLAEHHLRPFHRVPWVNPMTGRVDPRVLGERPAMRWRVSRDLWDELLTESASMFSVPRLDESMDSYLLGWPITADDGLPPNSVIFEVRQP